MATPLTAEQARLVEGNLALVHHVLGKTLGRPRWDPEYEDLYQQGVIGLLGAARRFDPTLGFAFSTFASRSIWGEIMRYCRDQHGSKDRPRIDPIPTLDAPIGDNTTTHADLLADDESDFTDRLADAALCEAIAAKVGPDEWALLTCGRDAGLRSQQEEADRRGCSQMNVSRLRRDAIARVRSRFADAR